MCVCALRGPVGLQGNLVCSCRADNAAKSFSVPEVASWGRHVLEFHVCTELSTATDSATTNCGAFLCVKHGGSQSTRACRLGSQDQTNVSTTHDIAVACRRVVEHW